jgi:hypothetical protein
MMPFCRGHGLFILMRKMHDLEKSRHDCMHRIDPAMAK